MLQSLNSAQIEVKSKVSKNNPAFTGTVTGITKAMVGLDKVTSTSDNDKPVSTAVASALSGNQDTLTSTTDVTVRDVTVRNLNANSSTGTTAISSTGNSGTCFNNPTVVGVHLQNFLSGAIAYRWIELCGAGDGSGYIDFT